METYDPHDEILFPHFCAPLALTTYNRCAINKREVVGPDRFNVCSHQKGLPVGT